MKIILNVEEINYLTDLLRVNIDTDAPFEMLEFIETHPNVKDIICLYVAKVTMDLIDPSTNLANSTLSKLFNAVRNIFISDISDSSKIEFYQDLYNQVCEISPKSALIRNLKYISSMIESIESFDEESLIITITGRKQ